MLLGRSVSRRIAGLLLEFLLDGALRLLDSLGRVIIIGGRRRRSGSCLCSGARYSRLGSARGSGLGGRSIRFFSALGGDLRFLVGLLVDFAHESLCTLFEGTSEAVPLDVDTRSNGRGLAGALCLGTSPGVGGGRIIDLNTSHLEEIFRCSERSAHLCKVLWIGSGLFGRFGGGGGEKVAGNESKVRDELAGFRIGDEELSEGSEVYYCLACVALGVLLGGEVAAVADAGLSLVLCGLPEALIRGVPDKFLESLVAVFVVDLEARLEGLEVRDEAEAGIGDLRLREVHEHHRRACGLLRRVC